MTAEIKWCKWCDHEHATDYLCPEAFSALQDIANLGVGARPVEHSPAGVELKDLGVDPDTVEILGGIGFNGGAVEIGDEWWVMLIVQTEDTEGKHYPARIMVTPLSGFERLRDWTVQVFDETIARTRALNEKGRS